MIRYVLYPDGIYKIKPKHLTTCWSYDGIYTWDDELGCFVGPKGDIFRQEPFLGLDNLEDNL